MGVISLPQVLINNLGQQVLEYIDSSINMTQRLDGFEDPFHPVRRMAFEGRKCNFE